MLPLLQPRTETHESAEDCEEPPGGEPRAAPPVLHFELQPGDVLYLPRGVFHDATAGAAGESMHVTLGFEAHDCLTNAGALHLCAHLAGAAPGVHATIDATIGVWLTQELQSTEI